MPYSEKAKELRRCSYLKDGDTPCRAWALWDDPRRLCVQHAGRGHRGKKKTKPRRSDRTRYQPCTCGAYDWPHRRGGGVCRWPDPPLFVCRTRGGSHSWPRMTPEMKAFCRRLNRRKGRGPAL